MSEAPQQGGIESSPVELEIPAVVIRRHDDDERSLMDLVANNKAAEVYLGLIFSWKDEAAADRSWWRDKNPFYLPTAPAFGAGPCAWFMSRFNDLRDEFFRGWAAFDFAREGNLDPSQREIELRAARLKGKVLDKTGIRVGTTQWAVSPLAPKVWRATAHTAVVVTIYEPGTVDIIAVFYMDAGDWGKAFGNLGGDNNIFFWNDDGTEYLITEDERQKQLEEVWERHRKLLMDAWGIERMLEAHQHRR